MARVIAVSNQKGGAGKTTTAVHLAVALQNSGKRVLLVDTDGQGNATTYLGLEKDGHRLREMLLGRQPLEQTVERTKYGVDVIAGGPALEAIDVILYAEKRATAAHQLKLHLDRGAGRWEYVVIDTPPNLGTATASALLAASEVLIPVQTEAMAVEGLVRLMENIEEVQSVNSALTVLGILPCMFSARESLSQEVEYLLRKHYKRLVFQTVVKRNTRLAHSYLAKQPIHAFDPKNETIAQFQTLVKEVVARGKKKVAA